MEIASFSLTSGFLLAALFHLIFTMAKAETEQYVWRIKHGAESVWLWSIAFSLLIISIGYGLEG